MASLFPQNSHFYKCNLHCHTVISDGTMTPEEVKAAYMAGGYSVVAFTDHEVMLPHHDLTDDRFIAITGFETAVKKHQHEHTGTHQPVYHLNLLALSPDTDTQPYINYDNLTPGNCRAYLDRVKYATARPYNYETEGVNELIRLANEAGFLVTLNHPYWSLVPEEEYAALDGLHAVEISNYGCRHNGDCSATSAFPLWRQGKRVFPIGSDDNHNWPGEPDSFGAFTMLAATEFSYRGLMEAYANGALYASEGPSILDLDYEGGRLTVRTSPAAAILLCSEGRQVLHCEGVGIEEACFAVDPNAVGAYFRVEVLDAAGHRAYSRAYFLDELN